MGLQSIHGPCLHKQRYSTVSTHTLNQSITWLRLRSATRVEGLPAAYDPRVIRKRQLLSAEPKGRAPFQGGPFDGIGPEVTRASQHRGFPVAWNFATSARVTTSHFMSTSIICLAHPLLATISLISASWVMSIRHFTRAFLRHGIYH